jgi:hypothetical protein
LREKSDRIEDILPTELTSGAILRSGEYAWEPSTFPTALQQAPNLGYACLGGQFWFLLPDNSLYEPFWLEANSTDKSEEEAWLVFARRSCDEVLVAFKALVEKTDFDEEMCKFKTLEKPFRLMFKAYFVTERQFYSLGLHTIKSIKEEIKRR